MAIHQVLKMALLMFIRLYRYMMSALLGNCCRFEPSCSQYALEAISVHGCFRGLFFTVKRLLRCHPWHMGGIDPVPLDPRKIN